VAQTRKKRRRKHKGTQGGRIDPKRRSKPRTRAEAKAQARARRQPATTRADSPPTWRSSIIRGLVASVLFTVLLLLLFQRPLGSALALGAFMLAFYIPAGYYIDQMMWRKRERARIRSREDR
jgi:hypothetical protein